MAKMQHGGKRDGAGRKAMFPGKRIKVSVKITERAKALVDATVAKLAPAHGHTATEAGAVEYLIRKATRTPLKDRPHRP
jgi:hypothetical protein